MEVPQIMCLMRCHSSDLVFDSAGSPYWQSDNAAVWAHGTAMSFLESGSRCLVH